MIHFLLAICGELSITEDDDTGKLSNYENEEISRLDLLKKE